MNMMDLLKKYESNESIDYLIKVFGSDKYINDIFTSTMGVKHIIDYKNLDYRTYEIFHNVYANVSNDKTIDNTILNCLIILESYYTVYKNSKDELNRIKNEHKILSEKELKFRLNNKIIGMYNINTIPKNYEYYDLAKKINSDINDFSLSEIFNNNAIFDKEHGFNAVTVISRTQNVSRFNKAKFDGMKGSGFHDTNFEEILKVIYDKKFENNRSGQDIMIRYATYEKKDGSIVFNMLLAIPLIINSAQKISLENLNKEIKELELYLNQNININISVVDYNTQSYSKYYNDQSNLDDVLNSLIINDNINDKYDEICFIGYSNLDNNYNKLTHVR